MRETKETVLLAEIRDLLRQIKEVIENATHKKGQKDNGEHEETIRRQEG